MEAEVGCSDFGPIFLISVCVWGGGGGGQFRTSKVSLYRRMFNSSLVPLHKWMPANNN